MKDHTNKPPITPKPPVMSLDLSVKSDDFDLARSLKATLFQYVKLYERWSEDRQEWTKQLSDVHDEFIRFENALNSFDGIDKKFRTSLKEFLQSEVMDVSIKIETSLLSSISDVKKSIQEATEKSKTVLKEAAAEAKATIKETTERDVTKCVNELNNAVSNAKNNMEVAVDNYNGAIKSQTFKTFLFAILGAMIGAIVIYFIVEPRLKVRVGLSETEILRLNDGIALSRIWSKLSKPEQNKIMKLMDEGDDLRKGNEEKNLK